MSAPIARRCRARSKQTGDRCRAYVKGDARVCHYHGGATRAAMKGKPRPENATHSLYASAIQDAEHLADHSIAHRLISGDRGELALVDGMALAAANVARFLRRNPEGATTPEEETALSSALREVRQGAAVLAKIEELRRQASVTPPTSVPITTGVGNGIATLFTVRTVSGAAQAVEVEGVGTLVQLGGVWALHLPQLEGDVEVYRPLLEAAP